MKLVFFGTPEFAVPPLNALFKYRSEVLAVVTQPDRKSGRGKRIISSPVKNEALRAGLTVLQPQRVKDRNFIDELRFLMPELIVVVAYGQILPPGIIHMPEFGCINVHASILPVYRGAAPINWAIINGEKKTGITTMLMDEGMDTGPVLMQEETEISPHDTAGSLSERLSKIGADVLIQTLDGIRLGRVKPVPQGEGASYAPLLRKTDGLISWSKSASDLCNFIRGVNPWPGAYTFLDSERMAIIKADIREGDAEKGVIVKVARDELFVGTEEGLLSIIEIQPSGKKCMDIRAFLQGRDIKEGMKFGEK
ncbi:MAG: methionyl-tRNA formyltransferase [Nitrospiraceae bacterium]|nr:MAG: methionyl-tRNA formyltransferase [Nitrospiraceae bacterium]